MIRPELKIATTTRFDLAGYPAGTRVVVSAFRVRVRLDPRSGGGPVAHPCLEARVEEPSRIAGWWSVRNFAFWKGEQKVEK